eukprot:s3397_g4.t1
MEDVREHLLELTKAKGIHVHAGRFFPKTSVLAAFRLKSSPPLARAMPAPPSHFLRAKGQDGTNGTKSRVLMPHRSDGLAGYHSDEGKRNMNALDLLKDRIPR